MSIRAALLSVLAAGSIMLTPSVWAGTFQHSLSLRLGATYDSNPNLEPEADESIWRGSIAPAAQLDWRDGRDTLSAGIALHLERSTDTAISPDREDPRLTLGWTRLMPRGEYGLNATYAEASTRLTELEESGLIETEGTRTSRSLRGHWSYSLDESTRLHTSAGYASMSYDRGNFTDYDTLSGSAILTRTLSERMEAFVDGSIARNEPDGDIEDNTMVSGVLGAQWAAGERLTASARGGANKLSQRAGLNWQGGFGLDYRLERGEVLIDAGRSVTTGAFGEFAKADHARVALTYALAERTRAGADALWREVYGETPNTLWQARIWAGRKLSPTWDLRLAYRRLHRDRSELGEATANVIDLSLAFNRTE